MKIVIEAEKTVRRFSVHKPLLIMKLTLLLAMIDVFAVAAAVPLTGAENGEQQKRITGTVTDASTGETLPGVNVRIEGTTIGAITDADGLYTIQAPAQGGVIVVSFVGYIPQSITYSGQEVIDARLAPDLQNLEEVVVIGYGVQKKSLVTGAISSVSAEDMENSSVTRAELALQGKSAGVQVISTSGSPGSELKVRIRGYSSNGKADPLYIVDGVKTTNISNLEPKDISNMEVLKDAASSAIYGAEGGNGVIIITTKSAKAGYTSVDYDFQYTLQSISKVPDMLSASEYAQYYSEAGLFTINPSDIKFDTNWMDEILEQGSSKRHYLSFSSGTEKTNFLMSVSSLNQDGIIVMDKDKYSRYTFRLNADTKLKEWLKVGNNTTFAYTKRNAITEDNESRGIITSALLMDPTSAVAYYDGIIPGHVQSLIDTGKKVVSDEDGNVYCISPYISKNPMNPFVGLANIKQGATSQVLQGSMYAELKPIKHLSYTSRFGYELINSFDKSWSPVFYYNTYNITDNTSVSASSKSTAYWLWENFANYTNTFGDHSLNVLVGMSAESRVYRYTDAAGGPMIVEDENFSELSFIASQASSSVKGQMYLDKKASYFGRLSYDYKGRYMLQGTIRRDGAGSSLLPPENRWGIFPSFSLGWVFTEEAFFPRSFITYGKLRGSWGQNGSLSNLSNFMYSAVITSTRLQYQLGDQTLYTVAVPNMLDNPELTWETSVQTDIGLDLRMLKDRLTVSVDYFNKKTTDLITPNTPPLESGNFASAVNGGDVLNSGLEFQAEFRKSTGQFNYSISANLATLKNEVTYLNPTIQRISGGETSGAATFYTAFQKGYPVWYFRGYATDGINETTGEANFVDQNNDGLINDEDKTFIGSAIPDLTYGLSINMSYRGFDFMATLQGQAGNENMILWMRNDLPGSNIPQFLYDGHWTASNSTGATRPKAGFDPKTLLSDQMLFDGSYMRVKQIQLGYNLPADLLNKILLKSARLYVSLEDYFTFTSYPGMDPEAGSTINSNLGLDKGMYPVTKKAMFGISVSF